MPNTELLRDDFINELLNDGFTEEEIIKILWAFDKASQNYKIKPWLFYIVNTFKIGNVPI